VSIFSGLLKDLVTAGSKVKAGIVKVMAETDNVILPEAEKLQPLLDGVAEAVVPGSSGAVNVGLGLLEELASVIDAGGAAAENNLANAGLDVAAIAAVKSFIPQLKAAATLSTPPVAVAAPKAS
jgi:hypothetical protein